MSLDLHPNCVERLRAALVQGLAGVSVQNGMFLENATAAALLAAQNVLPRSGNIRVDMLRFVSEAPLADFITGVVARELYEGQTFQQDDRPVPLNSLDEYSDLPVVADRLVASFNSLPWKYTVIAPLPMAFSEVFCSGIRSWSLSDTLSICCGTEETAGAFPMTSGIEARDRRLGGVGLLAEAYGHAITWRPDRAYLRISVDGFIGKFITTEPLLDAIGLLRTFYGLGLALRMFKVSRSYQAQSSREKLSIHRQIDGAWIIEDARELEVSHSETIRDLVLDDLDGKVEEQGPKQVWMRRCLTLMEVVFRAGERARSLRLGAQWLFDGYGGSDELLQFVQAAVVVEILLGEKGSSDLIGLGELLANRCAYLIAVSHSQRQELLAKFRKIYSVRSKIVHSGKSRLAQEERELFHTLRWMCRRIIKEEAELLKKDLEKEASNAENSLAT